MDINAKFEELGRGFEEFKKAHAAELKEIKEKGHASAETVGKVEEINGALDKLQNEIKGMQAAMVRGPRGQGQEQNEEKGKLYKENFNAYMRKGVDLSDAARAEFKAEHKDMSVVIDEDGGFLVRPEVSSEIVKKVYESSPMRALASVQTISTDSLDILQDLDEAASGWVGETQARTTTATPKLKMINIPVHELYAQPAATQKVLDDAAINLESWLSEKVSEKFARDEATAFMVGDGFQKPKGILSYAAGTGFNQVEQINSGSASTILDDSLIDLFYSLKQPYRNNASWLMQRATIKVVRKIKDLEGQYVWQPGLTMNQPDMILGRPLYDANDMQSVSGGNLPVAFGDFKAGYQIVDRVGIRVIRDVYTAKPYVLFYTTKRVGGGVKNFEAIKLLKIATN